MGTSPCIGDRGSFVQNSENRATGVICLGVVLLELVKFTK